MKRCPVATVTNLRAWEEHCMEVRVILAHELVEFDVLRIEPPFLPVAGIVGGDTRVANASIKPDVEHLLGHLFVDLAFGDGYRHTPCKVAGDGRWVQACLKS